MSNTFFYFNKEAVQSLFQINNNPSETDLTLISEMYTYKLLNKFTKKSTGPRDFPRQILQETH